MLSFWEKQSFLSYDYIILGAGIVGLSTAISIKERHTNASVLILERGLFPTGASTKNAGFACFGSFTELLVDIENMSEEAALQIVQDRWNGLHKLRQRLGDTNIDYQNHGGYELIREEELPLLENLQKINDLLRSIFNRDVFIEDKKFIKEFGFNTSKVHTILYNSLESQLDTGKMMKSLLKLAYSLNVEIITGAEATAFHNKNDKVIVEVENEILNNSIAFEASKLAICTNAFSKQFNSDLDIYPGRGMILITKPLSALRFKGTFHFEEGFYYFRNFENRILFGGGRNIDIKKETSTEFEINQSILAALHQHLNETIIPGIKWEADQVWTGIMAFGTSKEPIIKKINEQVVLGVRLSGMGVAIGTDVGEKLAKLLLAG